MQGRIEPKSHMEIDDSKGDSNMTVASVDNGENQTSSKSLVGGGAPSLMKNNLSGDNDNDDDDEDEDENSQDWCPLFMDGLPTNFASNNALAAIASLLNDSGDDSNKNDDENKKGKVKVTPRKGGGKVSRRTARRNKNKTCQNSPYDLPAGRNGNGNENGNEESSKKSATMGEAQLFLSMWKI